MEKTDMHENKEEKYSTYVHLFYPTPEAFSKVSAHKKAQTLKTFHSRFYVLFYSIHYYDFFHDRDTPVI